jgi:hypothetical protein
MHLDFRGWKSITSFALALFLALSAFELPAQTVEPTATGPVIPAAQEPILKVGGSVPTPIELKLSDLSLMPRADVRAKDRDGRDVTYSGVSLTEILRAAGLKLDPTSMPTPAIVGSYILVEAADG